MDAITFIRQALTQAHERLMATLAGLTEDDVTWRPAPDANAILEIAWHVARADDRMGRRMTGLGPELWDSAGWRERVGQPVDGRVGESYQFLKSGAAASPRLEDIAAYLDAIHRDTMERLGGLSAADLDRIPDPGRPGRNVATYFRHMVTHKNNHHGQIDFIRGLRHPRWNLPAGTGIVQP
jgi:uncharacterized damage-inducible protein DinB